MKRIEVKEIIYSFKESNSITKTSRDLGISRPTVYRWIKRAKSVHNRLHLTTRGLRRRSTRPKTINYKISVLEAEKLIKIRSRKHVAARELAYVDGVSASWRTIHRLLKNKNLITKQVQYRRPKFQNGHAMRPRNTKSLGYLQMDTKHVTPELGGLPFTVFEYAVIERSFRTDQDEFYYWLENRPEHIGQLNQWIQEFINSYNTWRPHQALDYKTPFEFVKLYQKS